MNVSVLNSRPRSGAGPAPRLPRPRARRPGETLDRLNRVAWHLVELLGEVAVPVRGARGIEAGTKEHRTESGTSRWARRGSAAAWSGLDGEVRHG